MDGIKLKKVHNYFSVIMRYSGGEEGNEFSKQDPGRGKCFESCQNKTSF